MQNLFLRSSIVCGAVRRTIADSCFARSRNRTCSLHASRCWIEKTLSVRGSDPCDPADQLPLACAPGARLR